MFKPITAFAAVFVLPTIVHSQAELGHWTTGVTTDKSAVYAATVNDSGELLGEYCSFSSKACGWVLSVDSACDKDQHYPVLVNTGHGAAQFELVCTGQLGSGKYVYAIKNSKELEELFKTGATVGIASPMQADQFKIFKFVLDGYAPATAEMESPFFAAVGTDGKPAHAANVRNGL